MRILNNLDAFSLEWWVDESGYEWKKGAITNEPILVSRVTPGIGARPYFPLRHDGLFKKFSELRGKDQIREFANQFGPLFRKFKFPSDAADDNSKKLFRKAGADYTGAADSMGSMAFFGTTLSRWQREIDEMKALYELWTLTENFTEGNQAELAKIVEWKNGEVLATLKTLKYPTESRWLNPRGAIEGDLVLPARHLLFARINESLADPDLIAIPNLRRTPDNHPQLTIMPTNLLSALWIQFAQFVSAQNKLVRCAGCGTYFQAGPSGARRADAETCGDTCRKRVQRLREPEKQLPPNRKAMR